MRKTTVEGYAVMQVSIISVMTVSGCFVSGGPRGPYNSFSVSVESLDDAEEILHLFTTGAVLDSSEKDKFIIIIGASPGHLKDLINLRRLIKDAGRISAFMIDQVKNPSASRPVNS